MTTPKAREPAPGTAAFLYAQTARRIADEAARLTVDDVPRVPRLPADREAVARAATLDAFRLVTAYLADRGSTSWRESERTWAEVLGLGSSGSARRTMLRRLHRLQVWGLLTVTTSRAPRRVTRTANGPRVTSGGLVRITTARVPDSEPNAERQGATTGGHIMTAIEDPSGSSDRGTVGGEAPGDPPLVGPGAETRADRIREDWAWAETLVARLAAEFPADPDAWSLATVRVALRGYAEHGVPADKARERVERDARTTPPPRPTFNDEPKRRRSARQVVEGAHATAGVRSTDGTDNEETHG